MTKQRMIELFEIEHECMLRKSHDVCDGNCCVCELVQDDYELHEMYINVISTLNAHEPRVMTLEEVKQHNNQDGCVWFEQPTYNADAAFVLKEDFMTQVISPYILGEPINHGYWTNGNYGKTWRCWTSRPTDKQREKEPWDGQA